MRTSPTRYVCSILLIAFLGASALAAAPQLRLTGTAIGPLDIAVGQNGPAQTVQAWNAGDGALSLTVSSPDGWLSPVVGESGPCPSGPGICTSIRIGLQTAALERGTFTGTVEVTDPNAVDAPQTITVTVQMGGGVPDAVTLYVAPNGSDSAQFRTTSQIAGSATTQSGGNWLNLAFEGAGSFSFVRPYRIATRNTGSLAEGTYNGSVNVTSSAFAPDVKSVPVTMVVTSAPIATLSSTSVDFMLAADTVAVDQYLTIGNRGQSALQIGSTTADADWLDAGLVSGFLRITADPNGMAPGTYEGMVTVESNAANSPQQVAVRLRVVPQAPPIASFHGVVDNASFSPDNPIPHGGIAALFGDLLSFERPAVGKDVPLVHELGGTRVTVNGVDAPLFYSSNGQINLQIPYETTPGAAKVQVVRDGQPGNTVTVQVVARNPRILTTFGGYAVAINTDGTYAAPPMAGLDAHPAQPGDTLVVYAIGFGATVPAVDTGAAAPGDAYAYISPQPAVRLGGGLLSTSVTPDFTGLTPGSVGLFQINFKIPLTAPLGQRVPLFIEGQGYTTNVADIAIE